MRRRRRRRSPHDASLLRSAPAAVAARRRWSSPRWPVPPSGYTPGMSAVSSPPVRLAPVAAGWAAAVTGVAIAGAAGADTSSDWYRDLEKPSWQPPGVVFGPVWTVLYVLIAIAATLAVRDVPGARRRLVTGLFSANLALNLAWTWIFFRGHAPRAAGVEILVLLGTIVALIRLIWPHNRGAALALAPYGAWVAFATALTWRIAARN